MAHERQCKICGSTYKYCPRCQQYASLPRWKSLFCSDNCKTIYDVIDGYVSKNMSVEDAKIALTSYDLKNITNEEIKSLLKEIMNEANEEPKKKEKKKPKVEDVVLDAEKVSEEIVNVD